MTLQQLLTLEAIINQGSFQAGAKQLHKTHPSVIAAIQKLEEELGFSLFDRSQYRATLTSEGDAFYERSKRVLIEMENLKLHAQQLAIKEETELDVIIGDITPTTETLRMLRLFFNSYPNTQLNLHFENLTGPNERLLNVTADIIIHHIDKADPRFEYHDFTKIELVPVVSADFLDFIINNKISHEKMSNYTQCIIRDTAIHHPKKDYHVIKGSRNLTVGDQYTKKQVIMQGMAWGYMPLFLVKNELNEGTLLSLTGQYLKIYRVDIVIARLAGRPQGAVAEKLWKYFTDFIDRLKE